MNGTVEVGNLTKTIAVNNSAAMNEALKDEYGVIIVEGDAALILRGSLKSYATKKKLSNAFNLSFVLAIWNPLLFLPVGLLGKYFTSDKVSNYRVDIHRADRVILIHRKVTLTPEMEQQLKGEADSPSPHE